nr:MAG TPA: hypothetical protein [Caudoviricetes sp.]
MSSYGTVTGKFVTHQEFGGAPVPLSGTVDFVPSSTAVGESTVYASASRTGWVRDGVLFESANGEVQGVKLLAPEGVKPSTLHYTVYAHLVDDAGRAAPIKPAVITIAAGLSVDLSAAVPVSEAVFPSQAPAPGGGGKGEPQRLSLEGRRLSLSDGGGSVVIPETDLTALTIRVSALENRPVSRQRLDISGRRVTLSDGGGSVDIPETDVTALMALAEALKQRVEKLESQRPAAAAAVPAVQDTGIRLLETISVSGGLCDVLIRRVGSTVQAWMVTTNPDRLEGGAGPQFTKAPVDLQSKAIPSGFLPALGGNPNHPNRENIVRYMHDNRFAATAPVVSNIGNGLPTTVGTIAFFGWSNSLIMRIDRNQGRSAMGTLVWTTTDAWPAVLPGTPYEN